MVTTPDDYRLQVLLILCLGTFIIQGCAGLNKNLADRELLPASGKAKHMAEKALGDLYPDRFNALHRVRLSAGGDTHVLTGFLSIDRYKRKIKMICQGEMGGTLFEVHIADDNIDVVSEGKVFKKRWIERYVATDIKQIYLTMAAENAICLSGPDGTFILKNRNGEQVQVYKFDTAQNDETSLRPVEFQILKNNRSRYLMALNYEPGSVYPEFITIDNRAGRYTLDLSVRYMMQ